MSNVPAIQDLNPFAEETTRFAAVTEFDKYPDPKPIEGTEYYYSYHRSGCADNLWDSDLFYIKDFETHLLANISGNECEGDKGIVISKPVDGKKKRVETISLDILGAMTTVNGDSLPIIGQEITRNLLSDTMQNGC